MDYLPEDIPEGPLLDPVDTLSFLFLDGAGKSKLGFHMDTMQATPCTCSSDSLYPPGCYDVTGAEIILANGLWGDSYAREDCVLLAGHVSMHTVGPLTPSNPPPGELTDHQLALAGCPMLRGSLVHWSHGGASMKHVEGACEKWMKAVNKELACKSEPGGSFWQEEWSSVRMSLRMLVGSPPETGLVIPHGFRLWRPHAPHIEAVVGGFGLQLRLRGGAALVRRECKKRSS